MTNRFSNSTSKFDTMHRYFRLIFCVGMLAALPDQAYASTIAKADYPGVFVFQNGTEIQVKNDTLIRLRRDPFSIRYFSRLWNEKARKYYTAQIAGFIQKSEILVARTGMKTSSIPYFSPGTGMAPDRSGFYTEFIIHSEREAHHYLMYENEQNRRVQLLSTGKDLSYFEFTVASFYVDDKTCSIKNFPYSELYLVVFIDYNLNERTDPGELTRFTIQFEGA